MIARASLAVAIVLSACGSLADEQVSRALAGPTTGPTPTPGSPAGVPAPGYRRVQDTKAGWSVDLRASWFDRPSFRVRGHEIWSYDPRGVDSAFPGEGDVLVRLELVPDRDVADLEAYADQWVWTATCRPCRRIVERADISLGGERAKFFSVWQSQPAGRPQELEPNLYWLVRSPYFAERVLVIRATPGVSPYRVEVERMVSTLQFFRPAPPELVPTRTQQQVLELFRQSDWNITRIEAKLMTWSQWERANNERLRANSAASGGPSGTYGTVDPDTLVWVVAYAGSGFTPVKGGPPGANGVASTVRPWVWAVSVQPAREPFDWGGPTIGGVDTPWPVWFDSLPDGPIGSR